MRTAARFVPFSAVYFLLAAFFYPYLCYYVDNPDTLSYITVAQKFASGNFAEAINGYWSPLICWLLVIPLKFRADAITAFKVLQIIIGWIALIQWMRLVEKLLARKITRIAVSFTAIPFILSYAFLNLTADLLFLTAVLVYINMIC